MRKISIYNSDVNNNDSKREWLKNKLREHGFFTSRDGELCIVIGGDGTFLSAVRKRIDENPVFVGFNTGNLGYFSEFTLEQTDTFISLLKTQQYRIQTFPLFEAIAGDGRQEETHYFMNDFVYEKRGSRAICTNISLDGQPFHYVFGDGILISTGAGSTAYNRSAHGSISLTTDILQLAGLHPITNDTYQSLTDRLILDPSTQILLTPGIKKQRMFRFVCDGQDFKPSFEPKWVMIRKSPKTVRVLRSLTFDSKQNLRHKLWGHDIKS